MAGMDADHFARVAPIVGVCLRQKKVALVGLPEIAPIVTHLAASGIGQWLFSASRTPDGDGSAGLELYLQAQHGPALAMDMTTLPARDWAAAVRQNRPDLIVATGRSSDIGMALDVATTAQVPALLILLPCATRPCRAISIYPGDDTAPIADALRSYSDAGTATPSAWDWAVAGPLCAGLARAMLLRDTAYRRADLEDLWGSGMRVMTLGGRLGPFAVRWMAPGGFVAEPPEGAGCPPFFVRRRLAVAAC